MDKVTWGIGGLTMVVFAGIIGLAAWKDHQLNSVPALAQCVEHTGLGMHIHPHLEIAQDGQPVVIPANVGIKPTCMGPVHTHDSSGTIHLEFPTRHDFQLKDFFAVWGQPLQKDGYNMTVTVDGQPNNDGENLILKDDQKIQIKYEKK